VVLACHLGVLVTFATVFTYSFSLMVKTLQQKFGWNRQQIALAFSLAAISVTTKDHCPFHGMLRRRDCVVSSADGPMPLSQQKCWAMKNWCVLCSTMWILLRFPRRRRR
jgi:hypothetical protein